MSVFNYSTTPASNTAISGINISEGCSPAGINDAIRQLMADIAAGPTTLTRVTSTVTLTNSTALTHLLNYTVAAGLLGTTRAIEVYLFGDFTNNTGSNQTLRLSGTFGGSQFYDMGAVSFGTNASARFWELRVVLQAHGATNSQFSAMVARVAPPGSVNAAGNVAGDFSNSDGYDNLAIDSTAAQTMSLDATLGAASASLTVNLKGGFLKLV